MENKQNSQPMDPKTKWRWIAAAVLAVIAAALLLWVIQSANSSNKDSWVRQPNVTEASGSDASDVASEENVVPSEEAEVQTDATTETAVNEPTTPSDETTSQSSENIVTEAPQIGVALPFRSKDGKLEISSLFQYTGLNPDCNWEDGSDTGAMILTNVSEEYLSELNVVISLSDGTMLYFTISDIPAGKTVWAFERSNTKYESSAVIEDIQMEARYLEDTGLTAEQITYSVSGIELSLVNNSQEDMENLEIRCHSVFDGAYFGGISFAYPVEKLAAGESATVQAADCYLGEAEITRIDYAD